MLRAMQQQINGVSSYCMTRSDRPRTAPRMALLSGQILIIAATVGAIALVLAIGIEPENRLGLALRATARWSFLWFWLASSGGALCKLFGDRFQPLALRARDLGLAFASAHFVHVSLALYLVFLSGSPFPRYKLLFFVIGVFWVYLLVALSFKPAATLLGAQNLRMVRTIGVEYIALVFFIDFYKRPFEGGRLNFAIYIPFAILAVAGPLLRAAAAAKERRLMRLEGNEG